MWNALCGIMQSLLNRSDAAHRSAEGSGSAVLVLSIVACLCGCTTEPTPIRRVYMPTDNAETQLEEIRCRSASYASGSVANVTWDANLGFLVTVDSADGGPILYEFPSASAPPHCFSLPAGVAAFNVAPNGDVVVASRFGGHDVLSLTSKLTRSYLAPRTISASFRRDMPAFFSMSTADSLIVIQSPRQLELDVLHENVWRSVAPATSGECQVLPFDYGAGRTQFVPEAKTYVLIKTCADGVRGFSSADLMSWAPWAPFNAQWQKVAGSDIWQAGRLVISSPNLFAFTAFNVNSRRSGVAVVAGPAPLLLRDAAAEGVTGITPSSVVSLVRGSAGLQIYTYSFADSVWHPSGKPVPEPCLNPKAASSGDSQMMVACSLPMASKPFERQIRLLGTSDGGLQWVDL